MTRVGMHSSVSRSFFPLEQRGKIHLDWNMTIQKIIWCGRTFMLNLSAKFSKVTHRTPQVKGLHNKTAHFLSMAYEENFVPQLIESVTMDKASDTTVLFFSSLHLKDKLPLISINANRNIFSEDFFTINSNTSERSSYQRIFYMSMYTMIGI